MSLCRDCTWHCTVTVPKSKDVYSTIHMNYVSIDTMELVPACGRSTGMPCKVPADRIACENFKEKETQEREA